MSLSAVLIRQARRLIASGYCTARDIRLLATTVADSLSTSEAGATPEQIERVIAELSAPKDSPDWLQWAKATSIAQKETLPAGETWFAWYVPTETEDDGIRLIVPHSDPYEHECPMDLLFESADQAYETLVDRGADREAKKEGWVLCCKTIIPVEVCNPPRYRNFYQ